MELPTNDSELKELLRRAYDRGFVDGLRCFAHWRDSKQFVGTTGTTLQDAVKNRVNLHTYFAILPPEENIE